MFGNPAREGPAPGLLSSLDQLCLRAGMFALAIPVAVIALRFATGYRVGDRAGSGDLTGPVLAVTLASFVLVPMLALASGVSALAVLLSATLEAHPVAWRIWRAASLIVVAAAALTAACVYDVVVIPAIS
jgi:hypothetical protein